MRKELSLNHGWFFQRQDCGASVALAHGEAVTLPHTWNARDGQDGGNDYYRGTCWYANKFNRPAMGADEELWLEFEGVAMTAQVILNGKTLARHEGGYSTFRVNLTGALKKENLLGVSVDNSANRTVYPQKADFTFYGGIYRDVRLLIVPKTHFALDNQGAPGLRITPVLAGDLKSAVITVEASVENAPDGTPVSLAVEGVGSASSPVRDGKATAVFTANPVRLWNGLEDPHLYSATAGLESGDSISARFGCRSFTVDADDGFVLNGRPYRLCGAARHQDRQGIGNALTPAEHEEDMALLREMGCNTVRLAHYQHAQYFYDLCDRHGMVAWAEIPYITEHMPEARANTLSQMTELVVQNYNHPSIVCWGLSNEITAAGGVSEDMVENHKQLNALCHRLDPTRPTAMAHAFMLDHNDSFVTMADICGYNLYFGWYLGEMRQTDEWFDQFRTDRGSAAVGLTEFGADANPAYQSANPEKGDWTESYQAVYHEHMLEMWAQRPYIWAMHVWNMFDFGADGRDEGGKPGQNQKGLVTFDRTLKKDAFYIYKAYLSGEPFVHLCGRRYVDRVEALSEIKVYSNQPRVTLYVDGKEFGSLEGDKIFRFQVPLTGEHHIEARSGSLRDEMSLRRVRKPNPAYVKAGGEVVNWFDKPEALLREGYFSILDSMEDLKKHPQSAALLAEIMAKSKASYGDVAKNIKMPEAIQRQMDRMPLQQVLKQASKAFSVEDIKKFNATLNAIPKNAEAAS